MKHAVTASFSALLAFAIATSCSVQHRSQEFACTSPDQCATGRTCVAGYCVVGNGAVDAPAAGSDGKGAPDAPAACPHACTSCDVAQKSCTIDCAVDAAECGAAITCPEGYSCTFDCSTAGACRAGINCDGASSCVVYCSGTESCSGIVCGPGACTVLCSGPESCRSATPGGAVNCSSACACIVDCGSNSCEGGVSIGSSSVECPPGCGTTPDGCEDTSPGCGTCP